jgi:hypothetical protein
MNTTHLQKMLQYKQVKLSLYQAVEAHRLWHMKAETGSQMAVRLVPSMRE